MEEGEGGLSSNMLLRMERRAGEIAPSGGGSEGLDEDICSEKVRGRILATESAKGLPFRPLI